MKVKALKGFTGTICMYEGEVRELNRTDTVNELIRVGYLEAVEDTAKPVPEKAETKAQAKPEEKTDENKRGKSKRN